MKFSALNVDFSNLSLDPLGSRRLAHVCVKEEFHSCFGDFLAIFVCKGVNCDEMNGDRLRLPANMIIYPLLACLM